MARCELCKRDVPSLDRHHLIPRTRHSNKRNKKQFDRQEVHSRLAMLCKACHKTVHATLSEKELERQYNTLADLAARPEIARFVQWVRKQPPETKVSVRSTKGKNRRRAAAKRRKR